MSTIMFLLSVAVLVGLGAGIRRLATTTPGLPEMAAEH
jgi:hypothetical protein